MERAIHANCAGNYGRHKKGITNDNAILPWLASGVPGPPGRTCCPRVAAGVGTPGGTCCARAAAGVSGAPCGTCFPRADVGGISGLRALGGTRRNRASSVPFGPVATNCHCHDETFPIGATSSTSAIGGTGFFGKKASLATCVFTGIVQKATDTEAKETFCLYSALLVLKFLALYPLIFLLVGKSSEASLHYQDLKQLAPFWLAAALFVTTQPNPTLVKWLMRLFFISRLLIVYNNLFCDMPIQVVDAAVYITHAISAFMILAVLFHYAKSW